jgi:MFS family permease
MPLYLTFIITLIGFVAVNAARVVLQLYALDIGANPTQVGILVASYYVCPLLLSLTAGSMGDRLGPQRPLLPECSLRYCRPCYSVFLAHLAGALYRWRNERSSRLRFSSSLCKTLSAY